MLVNLDENGKQCWATEVGELLCKTGFLCMFTQEWTADIRDKERYEMYGLSKLCLEQKNIYQSYIYIYIYIYIYKIIVSE